MKSPAGLEFDVQASDLSAAEQARFIGEVVETKDNDVIILFEGKRVLAHAVDLETLTVH
jgi:hypothetical protein